MRAFVGNPANWLAHNFDQVSQGLYTRLLLNWLAPASAYGNQDLAQMA